MNSPTIELADSAPLDPFCLFRCASTPFAIRLESVAEVLEVDAMVRLPRTPSEILGLCILRREVIPVVALRALDKNRSRWVSSSAMVLMLRGDRGPLALKIDVTGTTVVSDQVDEQPLSLFADSCLMQRGWLDREGTRHAVIDYDATWRHIREDVEATYSRSWGRDIRSTEGSLRRASEVPVNGSSCRGKS